MYLRNNGNFKDEITYIQYNNIMFGKSNDESINSASVALLPSHT